MGQSPGEPEVIRFLEGPQARGTELLRAFRIFWELIKGFRALHFVGRCVTVFGSARFAEDHPYYVQARECGAPCQGRLLGDDWWWPRHHGSSQQSAEGCRRTIRRLHIVLPDEQNPILI